MQKERKFWLRDDVDTQTLGVLTFDTETGVYGLTVEPGVEHSRLPVSLRVLQRRQNSEEGITTLEQHEIAKAWVMSRIPADRCHTDSDIFTYLLMHSGRCALDSMYILEVTNSYGI